MSDTKHHPSISEIEMADVLSALGDPVRLEVAQRLYKAKSPLTCQQASEGIKGLAVSSRSRCFAALRKGGIIHSQPDGRECYNILRLDELNKKFPKLLETILKRK